MLSKVQLTINIITEPEVSQIYTAVLTLLEQRGFDLQPQNSGAVSGYFRGVKILNLAPYGTYFKVTAKKQKSWSPNITIATSSAWASFVDQHLKLSIAEAGFKANRFPAGDPKLDLTDLTRVIAMPTHKRPQFQVDLNADRYAEENIRRIQTDLIERRTNHMTDRVDDASKYHSSPLRDNHDDDLEED